MNPTAETESNMIELIMRALRQLSLGSPGFVAALVRLLADSEGVSVESSSC